MDHTLRNGYNMTVDIYGQVRQASVYVSIYVRGSVLPEVTPRGFEFGGSGYIIIRKGNYRPGRYSAVKFLFRTFASDGLMYLMGRPGADFLSIELEDGHVVGRYDLGSGTGVLRSDGRYNDGQWHDLLMNRMRSDGLLRIDSVSGKMYTCRCILRLSISHVLIIYGSLSATC